MSDLHRFEHRAMKTVFTLRIIETDPKLAHNAALAAFELLDMIENRLSRYIEGSDVWQINHMQSGDTLFISELCYDCLRVGLEAYNQTGGRFDITLGRLIEHQKQQLNGPTPKVVGQLMLDPERPAIHCPQSGREVDLGGIGKGFALDRMQALLQEWNIQSALLSAGSSTQLAFGTRSWHIKLNGDHLTRNIELKNQALSASGTGIQGSHIISVDTQSLATTQSRIWLLDDSAAAADIWSTTAMLMTNEELQLLIEHGVEIYIDQPEA